MVQVGWNSGPFHAPTHHDADAIGAMTLTWNIAQAFLPSEVITATVEAVGDIGLPKLATRNVGEGTELCIAYSHRCITCTLYVFMDCRS
ncbi:hypothetical protein MSAN_00978100 [Mycena sanguinolenta]|uniref:Uncharacterized protein n=1 Tax=Mycena sanguinolenta TaxID=230812 RepID=A0A8H7DBX0_9AGAR|nr:hypothetical protein MSAN_00978100 [Mycena sanguinolenta]